MYNYRHTIIDLPDGRWTNPKYHKHLINRACCHFGWDKVVIWRLSNRRLTCDSTCLIEQLWKMLRVIVSRDFCLWDMWSLIVLKEATQIMNSIGTLNNVCWWAAVAGDDLTGDNRVGLHPLYQVQKLSIRILRAWITWAHSTAV